MKTAIFAVPGVPIDPTCGLDREPSRPPRLREAGFDEKFDRKTLFYEAVGAPELDAVRIIAPPLFNLQPPLASSRFMNAGDSRTLPFKVSNYDRQTQILVRGASAGSISLNGPVGNYNLPVAAPEHDLFAGLRTVFTLSRNNNLAWIRDWLEFYRNVHGANAVLIYDNASSDYDAEALMSTLSVVRGIEAAVVVRWPFKHGPTGMGLNRNWDSNFSQLAMMEHARWRFLAQARSVLNCDIDELVMSKSQRSVFQAVEEARSGVVAFHGDWVVGIQDITREGSPTAPMRFKDYQFVLKDLVTYRLAWRPVQRTRCKAKWAAVPERTPAGARWHIHYVEGWLASRWKSEDFRFRHFREISRSWKYDRTQRDEIDPSRHAADPLMERSFYRLGWLERSSAEDAGAKLNGQLSSFSS